MKTARTLLCHASTVLSVMLAVFLIINLVNPAMAFYDHLYTRILILVLCAVTVLIPALRGKPLPILIAAALSVCEGTVTVIGFSGGENNFFNSDAAQMICAVFAACSLVQGVYCTVKEHKE